MPNFPSKTTLSLDEDDDISQIFSIIAKDTELRYPDVEKTLSEVNIESNNIEVSLKICVENSSFFTSTNEWRKNNRFMDHLM